MTASSPAEIRPFTFTVAAITKNDGGRAWKKSRNGHVAAWKNVGVQLKGDHGNKDSPLAMAHAGGDGRALPRCRLGRRFTPGGGRKFLFCRERSGIPAGKENRGTFSFAAGNDSCHLLARYLLGELSR